MEKHKSYRLGPSKVKVQAPLPPTQAISTYNMYISHNTYACTFQDVDRRGAHTPSPNPTTPMAGSLNSSPMLKSVLLGKDVRDDFGQQERARVSSISGRPVRLDGVGIVIGNESSSESEDEEDTCKLIGLISYVHICRILLAFQSYNEEFDKKKLAIPLHDV